MELRLKFGSQRSNASIPLARPNTALAVRDLLDAAAQKFIINREEVLVSLNDSVFYGDSDGDLSLAEWGVVAGDLIYVTSAAARAEAAAAAAAVAEATATVPGPALASTSDSTSSNYQTPASSPPRMGRPSTDLPDIYYALMEAESPEAPLHCFAVAVHSLFLEVFFRTPTDDVALPEGWADSTSVVRLPFVYRVPGVPAEEARVTVTMVESGQFLSAFVQVVFANSRVSSFTVTMAMSEFIRQDPTTQRLSIVSRDRLVIQVRDELVEKIRQEIHSYFGLVPLGVQRLPNELQLRLLGYLDARSLCRIECTCSFYRRLGRYGGVWRGLLKRDFPKEFNRLSEAVKANSEHDWKVIYRQAYEMKQRAEEQRRRLLTRVDNAMPDLFPASFFRPTASPMLSPGPPGMLGGASDLFPPFPRNPPFW